MKRAVLNTPVTLAPMALALALFYRGGALPMALAGLLIFGALVLLRPDLGLLFVPLTTPLYLIPVMLQGIRASAVALPLHEVVLLVVLGATLLGWLRRAPAADGLYTVQHVTHYAPHVLFLLAGVLGVLLAVERGPALREFRWLIVEPLIFYALIRSQIARRRLQDREPERSQSSMVNAQFISRIVVAFVLGGALVGLVGLLQFVGLDLAPLLGVKQCFAPGGQPCDNVVVIDGVRRATSVYGHPNNLGLYLERVWPLAAALMVAPLLAQVENREPPSGETAENRALMASSGFFAICSLLCLGGIIVSFSRGAWLGTGGALATLLLGMTPDQRPTTNDQRSRRTLVVGRWSLVAIVALVVGGGLAFSVRGDPTGGSTSVRVLIWREAIAYILQHPMGLGLDQFLYYHDPRYGRSLIDPVLLNSSEVYAAHPHNLILDTWLRMGPLGLIAFGWLLARFFRAGLGGVRASARAPLALGALAAIIAALVHGIVDNFYFVPDLAFAFWLLLALAEAAASRQLHLTPDT